MTRALLLSIGAFLFKLTCQAQLPMLRSNATQADKDSSMAYQCFHNGYDFVITYTTVSYWSSNYRHVNFLALKNNAWLVGKLDCRRKKNGVWRKPNIVFKESNPDSAWQIIKHLDSAGFYGINNDTLNITERKVGNGRQVISISDGVDYRFEVITKNDFVIIDAYEPEFFFKKFPEIKSRELFIRERDWFKLKYKLLAQEN